MKNNKGIQFVGFSEALDDASDHLSSKLEKTLDFADNMYMAHGHQAVEAVDGITDRDIANKYAAKFVQDQLNQDEE